MPRHPLLPLLATVFLLSGCMWWGDATSEEELKDAFEEVVGFKPTASVKNTKSSYYWVRDSYVRWLYFECDDALLTRLRLSRKNPRNYPRDDWGAPGSPDGNVNAPDWWKDGALASDLERIDIDHTTETQTDVIQIWIGRKHRVVFASRNVLD